MLKVEKLLFIALNPKRFFKGLIRYFNWLFLDKIYRLFSILIFGLCPQYLYLILGNWLIRKEERWIKKKNPEDDWICKNRKKIADEINIVCRGTSLKKYLDKVNRNLPTFFVNFADNTDSLLRKTPYLKLLKIFFKHSNFYGISAGGFSKVHNGYQIDHFNKGLYPSIVFNQRIIVKDRKKKIIWSPKKRAYPDLNYLKKLDGHLPKKLKGTYKIYEGKNLKLSKKNRKIIKLIDKKKLLHIKDFDRENPWGSGLFTILLLGLSAKKVNIYGWDLYLKKNVDKYNYWELINAMSNKNENFYAFGPYDSGSNAMFTQAIYQLHYADRLARNKKYKIFSRLNKVHKQKRILKNIEKIVFENN